MSGNSSSEQSDTFDRSNASSTDMCYGAAAAGESSDAQTILASSSTDEGTRRQTSYPTSVEVVPLPTKRTSPSPSAVSTKGVAEIPLRPGREKTPPHSPPILVVAVPLQVQGPIGTTPLM